MSERSEQIEILATKLMGWTWDTRPNDSALRATQGTHCWHFRVYRSGGFTVSCNWNPFTNPADCEMLKAKINETYTICITRFVDEYKRELKDVYCFMGNRTRGPKCIKGVCAPTEYEAVCLAALQLPECLPDTTPTG